MVEVVSVKCNLVDNQYQNVMLISSMLNQVIQCFWKHTTEFNDVILTFTYQNGRPLEIEEIAKFDIAF